MEQRQEENSSTPSNTTGPFALGRRKAFLLAALISAVLPAAGVRGREESADPASTPPCHQAGCSPGVKE